PVILIQPVPKAFGSRRNPRCAVAVDDHRDLVDAVVPSGDGAAHVLPKALSFALTRHVAGMVRPVVACLPRRLPHFPSLVHDSVLVLVALALFVLGSTLQVGIHPVHLDEERVPPPLPLTADLAIFSLPLDRVAHLTDDAPYPFMA